MSDPEESKQKQFPQNDPTSIAMTPAQAGLSRERQVLIALRSMVENNGHTSMKVIYQAVAKIMQDRNSPKLIHLSRQGKAGLRALIAKDVVKAGFVSKATHEQWQITPEGRDRVLLDNASTHDSTEEVLNVDTQQTKQIPSNTTRGTAFEKYVLKLLTEIYPHYTWYHQGQRKQDERGLDILGSLIGAQEEQPKFIGVQVKFHDNNTAPSKEEWLKFLAGCFVRLVDAAIFVTTGQLTGAQRREAGEARIIVIEGRAELQRISKRYCVEAFEKFEKQLGVNAEK